MHNVILLYVFFISMLCMVLALPLGGDIETLERRQAQNLIIGYRTVYPKLAEEYNKAHTLTNVKAGGVQIGEGAYLTAKPGEWSGAPASYWQCVVFGDAVALGSTHKLWIPEKDSHNRPLFFKSNENNLRNYIQEHHMHPDEALLFSWIDGHQPPVRQMLIPPTYLQGNRGRRSLGISVKCFSPDKKGNLPKISAPWSSWNIPGYQ